VTSVVTKDVLHMATGQTLAKIHADIPGVKQFGRFSFPMGFPFPFAITSFYPVQGGIVRREFQQATTALFRQFVLPGPNIFWFDTPFTTSYFGFLLMGKVWAPGESLTERWIEQPVHPTLTSVSRNGNILSITGFEVVDSFGHFGLFLPYNGVQFTLQVSVNGDLVFASSAFPFPAATVPVPAETSTVDIVMPMNPDPAWSSLATTTDTRVSFSTSADGGGSLGLPVDNYRIRNLNLFNQVPATRPKTEVDFAIDLSTTVGTAAQVSAATVEVSMDDGATWSAAQRVEIRGRGLDVQATVPTKGPGPFFVSVKVNVTTQDGAVLDQTVIRAIQLAKGI